MAISSQCRPVPEFHLVNIAISPCPALAIVQVADALGDSNVSAWADMLARRTLANDWEDAVDGDAMLTHLLILPPHLLHSVLTSCLGTEILPDLLAMLSPTLHSAAISAAITQGEGTLELEHNGDDSPEMFLVHLAGARPPHPGLVSLVEAHGNNTYSLVESAAKSALLGRALAAHSTLREVTLPTVFFSTPWLNSFSACLAQASLPRLSRLEFGVDSCGGCAAMARCLKYLPTLAFLQINLKLDGGDDADGPPELASFVRAATCPASLPCLKDFEFSETWDGAKGGECHAESTSCFLQLLPLLHAPALTCLQFDSDAQLVPLAAFVSSLASLSSLRWLDLNAELHDSHTVEHPNSGCKPAAVPLPAAAMSLEDLSMSSACPIRPLFTAAAMMPQAGLTSLCITSYFSDIDAYFHGQCDSFEVLTAWKRFLSALSACTALQSLSLDILYGFKDSADSERLTADLSGALGKLSSLTQLSLAAAYRPQQGGTYQVLCADALAGALRQLPGLRSLHLHGFGARLTLLPRAEPVLHACAGMRQLTALSLACGGITLPAVTALLPQLTALNKLELMDYLQDGAGGGWEALEARFQSVCIKGVPSPISRSDWLPDPT